MPVLRFPVETIFEYQDPDFFFTSLLNCNYVCTPPVIYVNKELKPKSKHITHIIQQLVVLLTKSFWTFSTLCIYLYKKVTRIFTITPNAFFKDLFVQSRKKRKTGKIIFFCFYFSVATDSAKEFHL